MRRMSLRGLILAVSAAAFLSSCSPADTSSPADTAHEVQTQTDTAPSSFIDKPLLLEAAAASVVKLEAYDDNDIRIATGSGFAALSEGVIITACHVVTNAERIVATRDDGETFTLGRIIEADRELDLAICALPEGVGLPLLAAAENELHRGERVAVIGSQFGVLNLITQGNYCGTWNSEGNDWLLFTAPVSGGSSGAPVLNSLGEVIGVVSGTYDSGQNMNIATPIAAAAKLNGGQKFE